MGKAVIGIVIAAIIIISSVYLFEKSAKTPYQAPVVTTITTSPSAAQTTTGTPSANQAQNTVTLTTSGFAPATLTVKVGDTVTWSNKSGMTATINSNPHPVHTDYSPLNLGQFSDGSSVTLSFPKAGTYGYHNHLNPGETGTIIVQ